MPKMLISMENMRQGHFDIKNAEAAKTGNPFPIAGIQ